MVGALRSPAEIAAVMQLLADLGYGSTTESATGSEAAFARALKQFQADVGLEPTGEYDDATLEALTDRPRPSITDTEEPR